MGQTEYTVCAQLRVGDTELPTYRLSDIMAKIDMAQKLAGMTRLLFLPSHNPSVNKSIIRHCRKRGIEVYLWYKVLTDNDIMAEQDELVEDAFGRRGSGETAVWKPIFDGDEIYSFGCPVNRKYNNLLLEKCKRRLTDDYDGLFADCIGYPLASLGLESLFTCFCDACAEREPRVREWRERVLELREKVGSWTDRDLEEMGNIAGLRKRFGLEEFQTHRTGLITELTGRYAKLARDAGKGFGLDLLSPALAPFAGHDYAALGDMADFVKPRIYCSTYGPSSIPLEYYCMGMGLKSWAKIPSIPAVMDFVGSSTGLDMPTLTQTRLCSESARDQIDRALTMTGAKVFPGIECSLHPEYETFLDEQMVAEYVESCKLAPGIVIAWNLLFVPEVFLRIVGKGTGRT